MDVLKVTTYGHRERVGHIAIRKSEVGHTHTRNEVQDTYPKFSEDTHVF